MNKTISTIGFLKLLNIHNIYSKTTRYFRNFIFCVLIIALFSAAGICFFPGLIYAINIKKSSPAAGFTLLHTERHALPIVAITLLIKASPLNEEMQKAGTANLTAILLKEGTAKRKSLEISEEIEFIGASLDALTNRDYTTITMTVLKKDIEKGFEIFSDILLNPIFSESEIKRKKDLIKGSLKQKEEDPSFTAGRVFKQEVFGSHPYGRLVEGGVEQLDNIQRDDIIRFYNDYYRPQNSILSVVGDITDSELNVLLNKYLKEWFLRQTKTDTKAPSTPLREPPQVFPSSKMTIIERDITQANIILGHKGISRDNPDYYDAIVMNYLLGGGGFASRLMKVIRDDMGLTYSIYSSFAPNKEPGEFYVEVQTKNESAHIVIKEILKQIQRMRTEIVTDQELDDAKTFLTGSFPRRLDTSRKIADFLAVVEFYNLGDDYIKKYPEYIGSVTKEAVLKSAVKYLKPDDYILVIAAKKEKIDLTNIKQAENLR